MRTRLARLLALVVLPTFGGSPAPADRPADPAPASAGGWRAEAPRDEIRPHFAYDPRGGRSGQGAWVIETDGREGLDGYWVNDLPVTGGRCYRFQAYRKLTHVASPRRSGLVRLTWLDARGRKVPEDRPLAPGYVARGPAPAETEHPTDGAADERGWPEVAGSYRAPAGAALARVEPPLPW